MRRLAGEGGGDMPLYAKSPLRKARFVRADGGGMAVFPEPLAGSGEHGYP